MLPELPYAHHPERELARERILREALVLGNNLASKPLKLIEIIADLDQNQALLQPEEIIPVIARTLNKDDSDIHLFELSNRETLSAARHAFSQRERDKILVLKYPPYNKEQTDIQAKLYNQALIDFYYRIQSWYFHTKEPNTNTIIQTYDPTFLTMLSDQGAGDTLVKSSMTPHIDLGIERELLS